MRSDSNEVAFQITQRQCLVGFCLPGAFKDKNTPHHKLTRSLGLSDPAGLALTFYPRPLPHPPQAVDAVCPEVLLFKDRVLGASRGVLTDFKGACPSTHSSVPGVGFTFALPFTT